ncbi:hypothetical protein RHOSPDRAFT_32033 [Rhodotorula sp. JG-1b]|nr:hypothetical protein RHOSPDRAFT_32033 [Rhodotorula sp. JG-1b]
MSSSAASGLGAGNQALGEGSAGINKPRQGDDSQAGGREMNDSDASLKGDTSSKPNVNNEAPSHAEEGANVKTDSESSKFDVAGSSGSNQAEL